VVIDNSELQSFPGSLCFQTHLKDAAKGLLVAWLYNYFYKIFGSCTRRYAGDSRLAEVKAYALSLDRPQTQKETSEGKRKTDTMLAGLYFTHYKTGW
jgi:hypothetical protein